jgi:hypothetical protein
VWARADEIRLVADEINSHLGSFENPNLWPNIESSLITGHGSNRQSWEASPLWFINNTSILELVILNNSAGLLRKAVEP